MGERQVITERLFPLYSCQSCWFGGSHGPEWFNIAIHSSKGEEWEGRLRAVHYYLHADVHTRIHVQGHHGFFYQRRKRAAAAGGLSHMGRGATALQTDGDDDGPQSRAFFPRLQLKKGQQFQHPAEVGKTVIHTVIPMLGLSTRQGSIWPAWSSHTQSNTPFYLHRLFYPLGHRLRQFSGDEGPSSPQFQRPLNFTVFLSNFSNDAGENKLHWFIRKYTWF